MANGAHAIVFNDDKSRVLMVKRRDVPVWVFPGGGIEPNEKPEDAAIRETEEESGYKVKVKRLVGIYKKPNKRCWLFV